MTNHLQRNSLWLLFCFVVGTPFGASSAYRPTATKSIYSANATAPCANPGKDGSPTALAGIVNTYFPGVGTVAAGAQSISVDVSGGANVAIAPGDLLLIIQMQGADISSANSNAYGANNTSGAGYLNNLNFTAGQYEYVVANSDLATGTAGTVNITTKLVNSYSTAPATATAGRRSFQVVRVPQYGNVTLGGQVNAGTWNGNRGGVLALDIAGTLTLNGQTLNAAGRGFRGGGGKKYSGGTGTATDYRTSNTITVNASKGEGIAGTPRYTLAGQAITTTTTVFDNSTNTAAFGATAVNDGYPNGDNGRGAPGNAGGGSTDGDPAGNGLNAGGAGGSNGGAGGFGGSPRNADNTDAPNTAVRALGGVALPSTTARLIMGGGGGAGSSNDGNGDAGNTGVYSSGASGGGIIIVRTGSVSGNGTATAAGAGGYTLQGVNANGIVTNDATGGGGAGGTVLVTAKTGTMTGLTVIATGGAGSSNVNAKDAPHGPGGGGSGGIVLANAALASTNVAGGTAGTTTYSKPAFLNANATATINFGAVDGANGISTTSINPVIDNSVAGADCVADLSSVITVPSSAYVGQSVTVQATFSNGGPADAAATGTVTLPAGATVTSAPGGSISVNTSTNVTTITYALASLSSGGSSPFTIAYTATAAGTLAVSSSITSSTVDLVPNNNASTASTTVTDLGATGTPAPCANPGRDGSPTLTTNPNTYYPSTATQTLATNATSIVVGAATGTTLTSIAPGDLLLVIQMQGADLNTTNTDSYGDGVAGGGASGNLNTNFTAGTYEYVVAGGTTTINATGGGTITLATPLKNSYQNAAATATAGQRRFQVIRVPQYYNLTLGSNITATPWNGSTGGIIAVDVTYQTNLAGFTINASGAGFRGGAGRQLTGTTGGTSTDYVFSSGTAGSQTGADGSKGEGIAGTPLFVNGLVNNARALVNTGSDYPGGSNGRGAPGNAGGGGSDSNPANNNQNSGGGGGANGGRGGRGGNAWSSNAAVGGEPGDAFAVASSSRLVLGGGGGAGSTNDGSGAVGAGFASSGAAGGGMVILRTGTISSTGGTILANGANADNTVAQDGSGGGGAGGSILVTAANTAGLANLTLTANGGTGGTNSGGATNPIAHGPGGGGGGGFILTNGSAAVASATAAGSNGTTTGNVAFGAASGLVGVASSQISTSIANSTAGANCVADVTTTLAGPTTLPLGQPTGNYTVNFTNSGTSTASTVSQKVTLPAGVTNVVLPTGATLTGSTIDFGTATTLASGATNTFTFSFTAPTTVGATALTSNVTTATNQGLNTAPDAATLNIQVAPAITGFVYEDANYGGGAGRSRTTLGTGAVGRPGARVELYDNAGNFVTSTITDANGAYSLPASANASYTVRVVNNTVISARTGATFTGSATAGYTSNQLAVQTYNGTTSRVGGEAPTKVDAAAGTTGTTLASLNTATTIAESQFTVTAGPSTTTGPDFGFNFDVVTNTNNSGQGSLAQFITNANALGGEASLAQSGSNTTGTLPTSTETSIFMIPSGTAVPGQLAGLTSGLTNGVAAIAQTTALPLPAITGSNTSIDGTTQTFNIGNTNNVTLGAGGTVGTNGTTLAQLNGPEVQLKGTNAINGFTIATNTNNTTVRGLSIYGFNTGIIGGVNDTGTRIEQNVIGASAISFTDPGAGNRNLNEGINLNDSDNGFVTNNLIGFNGGMGVWVQTNLTNGNGANNNRITGNEIRSNALTTTVSPERLAFDGIELQSSSTGNTVSGNLITANTGNGIDSFGNTVGGNSITDNTISNNGVGVANNTGEEGSGLRVYGATNPTLIKNNVITGNNGSGVLVEGSANQVTISQNSMSGNTRLGIDLLSTTEGNTTPTFYNGQTGTASNVTINDNGDGDTGGNGLLNFPVITSAAIAGSNLVVTGYARPGSLIELFLTNQLTTDPTNTNKDFGQGATYLGSFTEGSGTDTNGGTGTYGPGTVNGLNQGTDNTNLFTFTIPLTGKFASVVNGTLLTSTATLTNSTSEFSGDVQVAIAADVTTTITGPNTLAAGQPSGTFTAAFSNIGTGPAAAVAQTVTLPANAILTTAQRTAITTAYPTTAFSTTNGVTTITFPQTASLAVGATNVYQFAFTAPNASGSTSIVSNVSTTTTQGPNIAPDAATFNLTVTDAADVVATIVGTGTSVTAGTTGTFTATFTNNGPASAVNTQPTVQLTPGLANVTLDGNSPTSTTNGISTYANGSTYNSKTGLLVGPSSTFPSNQTVSTTIGYTQPTQGNVTATAAITTTTNQAGQTANDSQTATNVGTAGFDLATTLSGPTSAVAGSQVTYAVTTLNNGPGLAPSALQVVSIPTTAALTNVFLTNGGTYSFSNGTSVFTFPAIPALGSGQQANNSISFTSPASGASSLAVTSLVTPNTPTAGDANTANNQVSINTSLTTPLPAAGNTANLNVAIASNAPTSGVAAGSTVIFTVTQGNNGPNDATNVATQVYLPAGLTGVVVKDKSGNTLTNSTTSGYNSTTGVVILPGETREGSASTALTYTISATAPTTGVVTATASVSAGTNDPVASDNVALTQVTVNVPLESDLATTLSGPSAASAGESIVYTVTTTNNSTTTATSVSQTVQLPAGLTGVMVMDANGNLITNSPTTGYNVATGLVTFATQATLGAGASVMRTISLTAPSNANSATGGSVMPMASVTSTSNDNVQTNNSASVTTTIAPISDFVVSLSGPTTIVAGNPVTYTVTTTNNGPSIGGQQTSVQLPTNLTGVLVGGNGPASTSGAISNYANGVTYNSTTGVLTLASVAAQQVGTANSLSNAITFNAPTNVAELTPTAQITPATGTNDATLGNNAATATTSVTPATTTVIDLATTVTSNATANAQTAGLPITFTVTSTNNTTGSSATGVVQQLSLAPGLTGVLLDGNSPTSTTNGISTYAGGTYNANTGVVTFTSATVANGTPATHTVLVTAPGSGPLVATAAIKGDQSDNASANNTNSTSITITPSADLVITTTGPTATQPSTAVSYSVVTANNGPSTAVNVVPTITLPAGATNVVLPTGATQSGNIVTFATVGSLASGQSATNTVTFTSPATAGSFTVSSSSSSTTVGTTTATTDPTPANNSNSLAVTNTTPTAVPVAFNVVNKMTYNATTGTYNSPGGNTAGSNLISPLSAQAAAGQSVVKYIITTIPTTAQGTLYYNAGTPAAPNYTAIDINQDLTPAQITSLRFDPADNATTTASVGDITFSYTAIDGLGKVSNTALYTIPVGGDNLAAYTNTPVKGGAVQYQNSDVITYVIDPNGAAYDTNGLIYQTTGANAGKPADATNPVKNGVAATTTTGMFTNSSVAGVTSLTDLGLTYNTTTGAISVLDRTKLKAGTYTLSMTTTDLYGGISTQPVTFTIGAAPLPVTLVAFTAESVRNRDSQLTWSTASEANNDHFEVERSFDGTSFTKLEQVAGQGTTSLRTAYAFTDVNVASKATGPVYYRLKQVDSDGTSTYSPVRTVSFTKAAVLSLGLYPNPAQTVTKLDLSQLPTTATVQVLVLDATGRTVLSTHLGGGLPQPLDVTNLATGTYNVVVSGTQPNGSPLHQVLRFTKE